MSLNKDDIERRAEYILMRNFYLELGQKVEEASDALIMGVGLLSEIKKALTKDWGYK